MTTTKIHSAIAINNTLLVVFYTNSKCWQFRVICSNGSVFGEDKIYYTPQAAHTAGRNWIEQESVLELTQFPSQLPGQKVRSHYCQRKRRLPKVYRYWQH